MDFSTTAGRAPVPAATVQPGAPSRTAMARVDVWLLVLVLVVQAGLSLRLLGADSFAFISIMRPLAGQGGQMLVEDPAIAEYYLPAGQRWSSTRNTVLPSGPGR